MPSEFGKETHQSSWTQALQPAGPQPWVTLDLTLAHLASAQGPSVSESHSASSDSCSIGLRAKRQEGLPVQEAKLSCDMQLSWTSSRNRRSTTKASRKTYATVHVQESQVCVSEGVVGEHLASQRQLLVEGGIEDFACFLEIGIHYNP